MQRLWILLSCVLSSAGAAQVARAGDDRPLIEIEADVLEDKMRGGLLGQVLGNLNGLPHELKYISEPGNVEHYTPGLPEGARTDDDTDIEWVYLRAIAESGISRLPPSRIVQLWKRHINRGIFCSNLYARQLMDLDIEPPWTGHPAINPWADFNISGQFLCESFGLMAPAMPQTAAALGIHYTHVAIDGEPAQATQLFATMLATAYVENDLQRILDAGQSAVDPSSEIAAIVRDVRAICQAHRDDWRATRAEIKRRWQTHGGGMRDSNGYELNTASTVAALLYGRADFAETLRLAFNFGWDCDNNAATAGAILGVLKGRGWMSEQGWNIADTYRNTTRDDLPEQQTITEVENTLIACARIVIQAQGGELATVDGSSRYRIRRELPGTVERLAESDERLDQLREFFLPKLQKELAGEAPSAARAVYVAICLNESERLTRESPAAWSAGVQELNAFPGVLRAIFKAPQPKAIELQEKARRAGLQPPAG